MGERNSWALRNCSSFRGLLPLVVGLIPLASNFFITSPALAQQEDGIAWLQKDMSCDDLTVEMRKRYAKLGNFNNLSEDKRQEVGLVLDIICGARFSKCGFKNCQKLAPVAQADKESEVKPVAVASVAATLTPTPTASAAPVVVPAPPIAPMDFQVEARRQLEERVEKQRQYIRARISEAQAHEAAERLAWVKVSVDSDDGAFEGNEEENPDAEDGSLEAPKVKESPVKPKPAPANPQISNFQIPLPPPEPERQRRSRLNPEYAAASPATPTLQLPSPGSLGVVRGRYLPKSAPENHKMRPSANLPLTMNLPFSLKSN